MTNILGQINAKDWKKKLENNQINPNLYINERLITLQITFIKHSSGDVTPSSKAWLKDNEMSRIKNMRQCLNLTQYKTTVEYRAHERKLWIKQMVKIKN